MKPTDFAYHLTTYLSKYLPGKAGIRRNTILSYRDTFTLLLRFCSEEKAMAIEKITLKSMTKNLINEFLDWLEAQRGCAVSTRNQRLAAIHSYFRYLQIEEPGHMLMCQQILSISMKRTGRKVINYLTLDAIKIILEAPDTTCLMGRRDLVLLTLLYDAGARVQEIADLTVADVRLENPPTVKLTGKGNRSRLVPLMTPTAKLVEQYLSDHDLKHAEYYRHYMFQNQSRSKLTRAGIAYILHKHVETARMLHPELLPRKISPHCFRHSKAMHLLQAGVNLVYIRDFLGHVSIKTTEIYARADGLMKRSALEKAYKLTSSSEMPVWQKNQALLEWLKELGH